LLALRAPLARQHAAGRLSRLAAQPESRHLHAARAQHDRLRRGGPVVIGDLSSVPWLRRLLIVAMLGGLLLLGFLVLDPFIVPVVWAAILAYVSWPGYEWLLGKCRGRGIIAALAMTTVVSAAVIAPLAWLAVVVRVELLHVYHHLQALLAGGSMPQTVLRLPWIGDQLQERASRAAQDPNALGAELRNVLEHSREQIAHLIGGISRNAAKLLLTVVSLFFVYRDGARIAPPPRP